jgi:hypothetical protein
MKKNHIIFCTLFFCLLSESLLAQSPYRMGDASPVDNVQTDEYFYDSGGAGARYVNRENSEITFKSPVGTVIRIIFEEFELESHNSCRYDWLKIFDGSNVSATEFGTYCGTNSPGTITSSGNSLTFQFHSDHSVIEEGWEARIELVSDSDPPVIIAEGNQGFCEGGAAVNVVESISITLDTGDTELDAMSVQISSGYENGEDLLTITGTHPNITSSWDDASGRLTLMGPALSSEFESAISNVQYSNGSDPVTSGARVFSITLEQANYLGESGHFYEFVSDIGIRWDDARDAASSRTYYGLQGYLATLVSQEESDLAGSQITGAGWIGASDVATEGEWRWVTGPEGAEDGGLGRQFWQGTGSGLATAPDFFHFWNQASGFSEPNQSGNEDYAHITDNSVGTPGSWNDLSITGGSSGVYQPKGYIVEYGGLTGDPVLQISAVTTITVSLKPKPIGIFHE